jgi:hypothetical protein
MRFIGLKGANTRTKSSSPTHKMTPRTLETASGSLIVRNGHADVTIVRNAQVDLRIVGNVLGSLGMPEMRS